MNNEKEYFEANRQLWDAKTKIHLDSAFYDVKGFLAGQTSLRKIELAELPDVKGQTILHSQCHFGLDTLSLQRMGALCTGIDLSSEAISTAKRLNDQLGLNAQFINTNIYDLDQHIDQSFDLVYTTYGTIGWLPDLDRWAHQLSQRLKTGGQFFMVDFHPTMHMFDWNTKSLEYRYFNNKEPYVEVEEGTYADRAADIQLKEYFWQHSLSEIFGALRRHGIGIADFIEYDYTPYSIFGQEEKRADQEYIFKVNGINLPLCYCIKGLKN